MRPSERFSLLSDPGDEPSPRPGRQGTQPDAETTDPGGWPEPDGWPYASGAGAAPEPDGWPYTSGAGAAPEPDGWPDPDDPDAWPDQLAGGRRPRLPRPRLARPRLPQARLPRPRRRKPGAGPRRRQKPGRRAWGLVGTGAAGAVSAALVAAILVAHGMVGQSPAAATYTFRTEDNPADRTFNMLLGINNGGVIAGESGSGAPGHPSQGYQLLPGGQGDYVDENVPGSQQTQVTALNDKGVTVGFWAGPGGGDAGFYAIGAAHFHPVSFPTTANASPPVNELLGVNDHGVVVGTWLNNRGLARGYEYSIRTRRFTQVRVPGAPRHGKGPSLVAAAISNRGDVAGFYLPARGRTIAFLRLASGRFVRLAYPGAARTQAFGVNDRDEVVGSYTTGTGRKARTHGFVWRPGRGFATVDDPQATGETVIAGVNDAGDLVGFYTDAKGHTDGMLALPR